MSTVDELSVENTDLRSTIVRLADEVRRLNPAARMCPRCDEYPMVLIEETEPPRAGERYWTCPWTCDVEWRVDHPDDAPSVASRELHVGERECREKAQRHGLTWYLWMGAVVVLDGGKRARLCSSGEFTVEGHNWEMAPGGCGSMRTATEEEQELWRTMP